MRAAGATCGAIRWGEQSRPSMAGARGVGLKPGFDGKRALSPGLQAVARAPAFPRPRLAPTFRSPAVALALSRPRLAPTSYKRLSASRRLMLKQSASWQRLRYSGGGFFLRL